MAVSSARLRPKSDCSGKAQKQLYGKLQYNILNFFYNPILFVICASTFSKLCKKTYTVTCRRVKIKITNIQLD
jgi:hypothetical protein